ncbi:Conglutin beta, partial [Thalictrum thalictroides]
RGLINLVNQEDRQTYNLEGGDVIRVPAGALIYLINRDNNQKFQIVSLYKPVSTPSNNFREFYGAGGENPESFYNTFSDEILEAAFDTDKEELDSLFRQQRSGEIVQVSQEQIKALSRDASSSQQGSPKWSKHGSQSWRPVNLLDQRATHSNEYGELYDVTPNEYPQLQDLDVAVSYHNISKGAMVAPFYNSRATSLIVVVNGNNGRFEMACPHLSSSQSQREGRETREQEQKQGGSVHYQKVSARLSPRTAFIVPAGHPVSIVASDNQNLKIVAFKINVENNQRIYLAGQNNLLKQLQREAKELAFNKPAREVETILNKQRQSVFLPGPNQRQQREQSEEGRHGGMLIKTMADVLAF